MSTKARKHEGSEEMSGAASRLGSQKGSVWNVDACTEAHVTEEKGNNAEAAVAAAAAVEEEEDVEEVDEPVAGAVDIDADDAPVVDVVEEDVTAAVVPTAVVVVELVGGTVAVVVEEEEEEEEEEDPAAAAALKLAIVVGGNKHVNGFSGGNLLAKKRWFLFMTICTGSADRAAVLRSINPCMTRYSNTAGASCTGASNGCASRARTSATALRESTATEGW